MTDQQKTTDVSGVGSNDLLAWLIEYRSDNGVGYVMDVNTEDGLVVDLTRDPHKAIKFKSRFNAQNLLDNYAFQRAFEGKLDRFVVCDHLFIGGQANAELRREP